MAGNIKSFGLMLLILVLSAALGMLLLGAAYCLPDEMARQHMDESIETLVAETDYYNLYEDPYRSCKLDNFTDTIMLSSAEYSSGSTPFSDAVHAYREESVGGLSPVHSLWLETEDPSVEKQLLAYNHYWHGYLLFLKPLLILFNYMQIRSLNLVIQTFLVLICLGLVFFKKNLRIYTPAFLVLFIFQDIYLTSHSLQFSSMFYLYTLGSIFLLLFYEKIKAHNALPFYFLIMGILTSYIDFLTYPLVSYGIPATLYLLLEEKPEVFSKLKNIVIFGLSWILGYAGMWLSKGVVGGLITGENIMEQIFGAVLYRTDTGNHGDFTRLETIIDNITLLSHSFLFDAVFALCVLSGLVLVFLIFRKRSLLKPNYIYYILNALPFLLLAASPFCWYTVLSNHSWIHDWFTFRTLYVAVFALICLLLNCWREFFLSVKE